jgi:PKD repeat protein
MLTGLSIAGCDRPSQPTAKFTADIRGGYAPLQVTLSDTSIPGSQAIESWSWDLGNGQSSTAQNPQTSYDSPGFYTITLTVTTPVGTSTSTRTNFVGVLPPLSTPLSEEEFNDNPTDANAVGAIPFAVIGAIQEPIDGDYFRFSGAKGQRISAVLYSDAPNFHPVVAFASISGEQVRSWPTLAQGHQTAHAATSAELAEDGEYLVIVNEAFSRGLPAYTYRLEVFIDDDSDGLPIILENAYGLDAVKPDADNDDHGDAVEFGIFAETEWIFDADGDGIPNWNDTDADGDAVPDELEPTSDTDRDALPAFVDGDSDNSGIVDGKEFGDGPPVAADDNSDGNPNFTDLDNDGDAIIDVRDPDASKPLEPDVDFNDPNLLTLVGISVVTENGTLSNAVRGGDVAAVSGSGFVIGQDTTWLLLKQQADTVNVPLTATATSEATATLPFLLPGEYTAAVFANGKRSKSISLQVFEPGTPVLFQQSASSTAAGTQITLAGENLAGKGRVEIGGVAVAYNNTNDDSLTVRLPSSLSGDSLRLVTGNGPSNTIDLRVTHAVSGQVTLSSGLAASISPDQLVVLNNFIETITPQTNGRFTAVPTNAAGAEVLTAFLPDEEGEGGSPIYYAYVLPSDSSTSFNALSTAVAVVITTTLADQLVSVNELAALRATISNLPAVRAFADAIDAALRANIAMWDAPPQPVLDAFVAAADEVRELFPNDEASNRMGSRKAEIEATIDPTEQYDVMVTQTPRTGNVTIENDTSLYLSAQFKKTDGSGKVIFSHISHENDPYIIGPQLPNIFWAKKKDFPAPNYQDCEIEIASPGLLGKEPPVSLKDDLGYRFLIDVALVPILTNVFGNSGKVMATNLLLINRDKLLEVQDNIRDGEYESAVITFYTAILEDIVAKGPLTQKALSQINADNRVRLAVYERWNKIGVSRFNWVLGTLKWGSLALNIEKAIYDLSNVPGIMTFDVTFPVEIQEILPSPLCRDGGDVDLRVKGSNIGELWIVDANGKGKYVSPQLRLVDGSGKTTEIEATRIVDNREVTFPLPGDLVKEAQSPFQLTLFWGESTLKAPEPLEIVEEPTIGSIVPDKGAPGNSVDIVGACFSEKLNENIVVFSGEDSSFLRATVTRVDSENGVLNVIVPDGAVTGPVFVDVNGRISNGYNFTVISGSLLVTFGDCGSVTDDTFALFVDGTLIHSMSSPAISVGPFEINLPEGPHNVVLRGITAPDEIGTYCIDFAGAIENVQGASTYGDDLTAGVEKHWVVTISATEPENKSYQPEKRTAVWPG